MSKKKAGPKPPKRTPSTQFITMSPGPTIEAGEKTWRLGFNTQNAKGRLEELVRAQVVRDALKLKTELPGDDGETLWQDTRDSLAAGHYDTFEKGWFRVLKSEIGNRLFLLSLLQKHHPDATATDALSLLTNHREQVDAALAVISPDFLHAVARQTATQKGATPHDAEAVASELMRKMQSVLVTGSG